MNLTGLVSLLSKRGKVFSSTSSFAPSFCRWFRSPFTSKGCLYILLPIPSGYPHSLGSFLEKIAQSSLLHASPFLGMEVERPIVFIQDISFYPDYLENYMSTQFPHFISQKFDFPLSEQTRPFFSLKFCFLLCHLREKKGWPLSAFLWKGCFRTKWWEASPPPSP